MTQGIDGNSDPEDCLDPEIDILKDSLSLREKVIFSICVYTLIIICQIIINNRQDTLTTGSIIYMLI